MAGFWRVWLGCIALMCASAAVAQPARPNHIRAELAVLSAEPRSGGTTELAIVFTPDPGWHGYWSNPGDAGQGAIFDWSLPPGASVGAPRYPVPQRLLIADLMNHVYKGPHAILLRLKLPSGLAPGTILPIRARGRWLACTDAICVPEQGQLAIDLLIGNGAVDPAAQARFDAFEARLPRMLDQPARFERLGETLRIAIPFPASAPIADAWFFSATEEAIAYAQPQRISRNGDTVVIETRAAGDASALEGVFATGGGQGFAVRAGAGPVPAAGQPIDGRATAGIWIALLGALAGGLLLNIMPCVFPIISLKALSLAKAGGDPPAARRDAVAYTAGVVLTCLALGGLLLGLRAAGREIGWAFQLQSPAMLFLLFLLAVAITLNLLGRFELPSLGAGQRLTEARGATGSFWTGALAAFVATPCTGPFMAAALGAALILPTAQALAIFAGLGLGLALPFLAIGFVPALRKLLPRPGPWMERFRRILAIPMTLTGLAVLWLLWSQLGWKAVGWAAIGVALLLIMIEAARRPAPWWRRAVGGLAVILIAMQAAAVERIPARGAAQTALGAVPYSEAALAKARADGPVFLYFTADWCLTCKVNEKAAIERDEVAKAFKRGGVTVMTGDWTRPDPAITRFLESRGRSGIPLYLFYAPGREPVELPQLLTPSTLTALVS